MVAFYPTATAITETESLQILSSALKKRSYVEALAVTESETPVANPGLIWFVTDTSAETESLNDATGFLRYFPSARVISQTESAVSALSLWPEPPMPIATVSCKGKDLHKQTLKQGDSHQITLQLSFTETNTSAVGLTDLIFEILRKANDAPTIKKSRFGIPGGLIVDFVQDLGEGKILLVADLQLRPPDTSFAENEIELNFSLKSENSIISQSSEIAKGTVIFYK